jgi:phosphoribosylformylglycinamidine synthase
MAAAGHEGQDQALYDAVRAVGLELCPALDLTIPVGKDSMAMRTVWDGGERSVVAPVSLIVSAFARVGDVRRHLTPELGREPATRLFLIDLGRGQCRLGASILAQVYKRLGRPVPDVDDPGLLEAFFEGIQQLISEGRLLAYHDRSDGGLLATLSEMAFAGAIGLDIALDDLVDVSMEPREAALRALFNEELGAVVEVRQSDVDAVRECFARRGLSECIRELGRARHDDRLRFTLDDEVILEGALGEWRRIWSDTSYRMQALRDNPSSALDAYDQSCAREPVGLTAELAFDPSENVATSTAQGAEERPRVAILREQGVNGHVEMAAAFHRAGFAAVDVHMSDLLSGRYSLDSFRGLACCGGFSYGDVLGAGLGWAKTVLHHGPLREQFQRYFARENTFSLGVCNGCQALAALKDLIVGAEHFPRFVRNESDQFEARLSLVRVEESPSILLRGMAGSRIPVAVAHGEGRAEFQAGAETSALCCLRFVDGRGAEAARYPQNPNGSPAGITGLTTPDGRVTVMMPHPERVFRTVQLSWHPSEWGEDSPWMRLFRNARQWVG